MNKIKFIAGKTDSPEKRKRSLAVLLFLTGGVCAILEFLHGLRGISCAGQAVYPTAVAICALLWHIRFRWSKWFPAAVVVGTISFCVSAFRMWDTVQFQLTWIADCIAGTADAGQAPMPVTETMVLLTFPLSLLVFYLELLLKNHAALYLLTTALLLLTPLYRLPVSNGATMLILFFQIAFWVLHWWRGDGGTPAERKSVNISAFFLLLCVIAGYVTVWHYPQELFTAAIAAEGYVHRTLQHLSGQAHNPSAGGRINGGNNYYTGTPQLELTLSAQPTEPLYLRGFSGGEYIGGEWLRADDEAILDDIERNMEWQESGRLTESGYLITGTYRSMYYMMNLYTRHEEEPDPYLLTLRHLGGTYENSFTPYYSQRRVSWKALPEDDSYSFLYFEQADMDILWDRLAPDMEQMGAWCREQQRAYMEEIRTVYTQVPVERVPHLAALTAEYPLENLDEISSFILYILHNNASYTLTPGWAPLNRDIAEYFLFQSQHGYCQHFALTATLMYRLFGVPARYASGYRVQASDFEPQEDGTWRAVATDEAAHAWVEIFLEDYGWTPVEVTPSANGSTVARYPGFDRQVFNRILSGWRYGGASNSAGTTDAETEKVLRKGKNPGHRLEPRESGDWGRILTVCVPIFLLLSLILAVSHRLWRLKRMSTYGCRNVYSQLMDMLRFGGFLPSFDGSEKEFPGRLSACFPQIQPEDIAGMWNIVCVTAYGTKIPSEEEKAFVRTTYRRIAEAVYGTLTWQRKLLFRYWMVFG